MIGTRLVECEECGGYGKIETGCGGGGGCDSPGYCFTSVCEDCNGSGRVHKLCDTDGCNHGDCEEAAKQAARMDAAAERHDHYVHDAYDREGDR